jgi:cold shock protein
VKAISRGYQEVLSKGVVMQEGIVKWYSEKKGFGFIETEHDGDIFMHGKSIKDHGYFTLSKSDKVTFEIKETRYGRQAANVRIVK